MSTAKVLIVDDDQLLLTALARALRTRYDVTAALCADEALETLEREGPFAVVLTDFRMPGATGVELLHEVAARSPDTARLMLSGQVDVGVAIDAINDGNVLRLLTKPCPPELLLAAVEAGVRQYELIVSERDLRLHLETRVSEQVQQIESSHLATIFALATLAEHRDPDAGGHLYRIREHCRTLATALAADGRHEELGDGQFVERIFQASPLHDIGKVGIRDSILLKPGRLTPEERRAMEKHTAIGANTLTQVEEQHPGNALVRMGMEIAHCHHERWDGAGYPRGLRGEEIPLSARILAVADVYDALRSRRCYKPPMSHEASRELLIAGRGEQFDPSLIDVFLAREDAIVAAAETYADDETTVSGHE